MRTFRIFSFTAMASAALALAQAPASAQGVTVYGRIVLSANSVKTGDADDQKQITDNASRLGFRGTEDLGGDMKAQFGLEMGLNADTGASTTPAYRNAYVALGSGLGTVALGRLDSANPTGSALYSQVTAIASFAANDAGATAIGTSMLNARNRTSNSLGYMSPTWNGFNLRLRGYLRGAAATPDVENGAKSLDVGLNYTAGALKAALGFGKDMRPGGLADNEFDDKWQLGARYDLGVVAPYMLYGRDRYENTATSRRSVDYWIIGAKAISGAHAVVLNLMQRDVQTSLTGKRRRWQAAYLYDLSKRTQLQAFVDRDGVDSSQSNVAVRAFGAGIKHDF
ncbi:MAG TPA: porin [Ideonella sp.]|uniref:porin n=1 Tax=Ideonella sp. TaxID=1929293 RepID=UPI002E34832C|nr:porin [Ideonella sp.]HEX5685828.1 porin [Ideonella sp.]